MGPLFSYLPTLYFYQDMKPEPQPDTLCWASVHRFKLQHVRFLTTVKQAMQCVNNIVILRRISWYVLVSDASPVMRRT
jgi:hypothetical protein